MSKKDILKFSKTLLDRPINLTRKRIVRNTLPEIRDKMALARAHEGHNGCEFVQDNVWR